MVFGGLEGYDKMSWDRLGGSGKHPRKVRCQVQYVAWRKRAAWQDRMQQIIIIVERKKDDENRSLYTVVTNSKNRRQVVTWGVKKHKSRVHIAPHACAKPRSCTFSTSVPII